MKHEKTRRICIILLLFVFSFSFIGMAAAEDNGFDALPAWDALPVYVMTRTAEGASNSFVHYPQLITEDSG